MYSFPLCDQQQFPLKPAQLLPSVYSFIVTEMCLSWLLAQSCCLCAARAVTEGSGPSPKLAAMSGTLSQAPWHFSTPQLRSGECCSVIWHAGIAPWWFYTTKLCPIAPGNCFRKNPKHFQKSIYSKCKILSIHPSSHLWFEEGLLLSWLTSHSVRTYLCLNSFTPIVCCLYSTFLPESLLSEIATETFPSFLTRIFAIISSSLLYTTIYY